MSPIAALAYNQSVEMRARLEARIANKDAPQQTLQRTIYLRVVEDYF
jgi:hypothetical protein